MSMDNINKICKEKGYAVEHIYGIPRAFSFQNKYLVHFNSFVLSLIVTIPKHSNSEKYDFAVMDKKSVGEDELEFAKIEGINYGVRVCENEKDMLSTFRYLVDIDERCKDT